MTSLPFGATSFLFLCPEGEKIPRPPPSYNGNYSCRSYNFWLHGPQKAKTTLGVIFLEFCFFLLWCRISDKRREIVSRLSGASSVYDSFMMFILLSNSMLCDRKQCFLHLKWLNLTSTETISTSWKHLFEQHSIGLHFQIYVEKNKSDLEGTLRHSSKYLTHKMHIFWYNQPKNRYVGDFFGGRSFQTTFRRIIYLKPTGID